MVFRCWRRGRGRRCSRSLRGFVVSVALTSVEPGSPRLAAGLHTLVVCLGNKERGARVSGPVRKDPAAMNNGRRKLPLTEVVTVGCYSIFISLANAHCFGWGQTRPGSMRLVSRRRRLTRAGAETNSARPTWTAPASPEATSWHAHVFVARQNAVTVFIERF